MTGQDNERPRSLFSWLRNIFRPSRSRPPIIRQERDLDEETLQVQIDIIRRAFDEKIGVASRRDGGLDYLYHPERALVGRDDVDAVQRYFDANPDIYQGSGSFDQLIDGLMIYRFPPLQRSGEVDMPRTLDELDNVIRPGVATPDHVLYVVGTPGKACPATEPLLPPSGAPVPALSKNSTAGENVHVSVVDTGWSPGAATDKDSPWLQTGVAGDVEQQQPGGLIQEYAGHGTFVSGVIKCMAPATTIEVEGFLTKGGAIWESAITQQLDEAMSDSEFDPQLISISAGTHTRNDHELLGFVVLSALYRWTDDGGPLVIAAAGNDGSDKRFFPAAFDWVLGVGSLDRDGKRSDFSNFGPWVDVYAQGRDLVNAYLTGTYKYVEPASGPLFGTTAKFSGLAQWSGTSFSTPVVTGAIAAYMSDNPGTSARKARDVLIAAAPTKQDQKAGTMKALGPPFVP